MVATRVGSLAEVVEPSGMGLLIHPGDPREFSRALLDLVSDAELRAEMGKCAQRVAETIISHQEVARRALGIYRAVVEDQK